MRARQEVPDAATRLLQIQEGVITRAQFDDLGLHRSVLRRLVTEERWLPLESGLYVETHRADAWASRAWGAYLLSGEQSRLWRTSAAVLHKLDDKAETPIEVLTPDQCGRADRAWVHFTRERPGVRRVSVGGLPRTHIDDTVLDLCAAGDEEAVITWVTRAVQRRRTTPESLRRSLDRRDRLRHRRLILDLIADATDGVHSHLERRYKYDVERPHGLPAATRQARGGAGDHDIYYDAYKLVVELDGERWHRERQWQDRRRDNRTAVDGALTLRFGWPEVTTGACVTAREVAAVLWTRGWTGPGRACRSCVWPTGL